LKCFRFLAIEKFTKLSTSAISRPVLKRTTPMLLLILTIL
jgi:hypothetical protein